MEQPQVDPSAIELSEIEFDHEELRVFWELARYHAKLNAAPTYFGPTTCADRGQRRDRHR